MWGPELNYIEIFYFPQDTPVSAGPTEIAAGTHFGQVTLEPEEERRKRLRPEFENVFSEDGLDRVLCDGPAGTIVVHHKSVLHRRAEVTESRRRHMLKWHFWRTSPPTRDWIPQPGFDLQTAFYGPREVNRFVAHMLFWLWGMADDFRIVGSQGWPDSNENQIHPSYGFPGKATMPVRSHLYSQQVVPLFAQVS